MSGALPPPGPPRILALAQLTNSVGDGAFYACSALYFTRMVGISAAQVGLGLTIAWLTGMLAGVPLGRLADRWGPRRTAMLLLVGTATALTAFLAVRSFPLFVGTACWYACCQAGQASARNALLAGLVAPGQRTQVRAYVQSTLNAGLAIGAGIGGLALTFDTRPAYLTVLALDAATFLAAAQVLRRLPEVSQAPTARTGEPRLAVLRDPPYALITFLNAIMYLNMPVLSLGLPLWIAYRTDAPTPMVGVLLMLNMLGVALFQVRVARRVTDLRTASRTIGKAGALLLAACCVYALSSIHLGAGIAVAVLLVAAMIQVVGEMMHGSGGWHLSFELAAPDKHGQYQGFFGMAPQLARALGPVLLTTLLIGWGAPGWLVLGFLFLLASLAVAPVARWAERRHALLAPDARSVAPAANDTKEPATASRSNRSRAEAGPVP